VLNAAPEAIEFTLPTVPDTGNWTTILNTVPGGRVGHSLPAGFKSQAPGRSVLAFSGSA
jgi:isoamylase